jgi:hypothetical protein
MRRRLGQRERGSLKARERALRITASELERWQDKLGREIEQPFARLSLSSSPTHLSWLTRSGQFTVGPRCADLELCEDCRVPEEVVAE